MPLTECNCWMPDYAYTDWLVDQGWDTEGIEEELNFTGVFGFFSYSTGWKTNGNPSIDCGVISSLYSGVCDDRGFFIQANDYNSLYLTLLYDYNAY